MGCKSRPTYIRKPVEPRAENPNAACVCGPCGIRYKPHLEKDKPKTEENVTCEDQNGISCGVVHCLIFLPKRVSMCITFPPLL